MTSKQPEPALFSPTGLLILGTLEANAKAVARGDVVRRNGAADIDYEGQTDIDWNHQTTVMVGDELVYMDEDDELWLGSELVTKDELAQVKNQKGYPLKRLPADLPSYNELLSRWWSEQHQQRVADLVAGAAS